VKTLRLSVNSIAFALRTPLWSKLWSDDHQGSPAVSYP
jgi:hypothetical protein